MSKEDDLAATVMSYIRRADAREAKEELETLREHVKLWIPVIEQLSRDYKHATGVSEIHPIHQDLIHDMKESVEVKK